MYSQQQLFPYEKDDKKPLQTQEARLVTIQQIYEVDSITLEQLVEEFQKQLFYKHFVGNPQQTKHLSHKQISSKFMHLSNRYLKQWYHLAKIELKQRQKIQLFALKLIHQDLSTPDYYLPSNMQLPQKDHIKKTYNQEKVSDVCPSDLNLNSISINLKTPIIKTQNPTSQLSINKPPCQHDKNKSKPQIFNPSQMKTLQVKSFNKNSEKNQKILSKKEFLEMMKIKLNKGTDYKTTAFINQPLRKTQNQSKKKITQQVEKRYLPQNNQISAPKMKSKSVYLPSNGKIDNLSVKNTQRKKIQQSERLKGRYKTQSSYATSRQSGTTNVSSSNNFPQKNEKNCSQSSRTVPVSRMGKNLPQEIMSKQRQNSNQQSIIKIINEEKVTQMSTITLTEQSELQKILKKTIEPHQSIEQQQRQTKISQKMNVKREQSIDAKRQQPSIQQITANVEKQSLNNNSFPIFVQNEDAYDDEPEILQSEVVLEKEQNTYQLQSNNSTSFISTLQQKTQSISIQQETKNFNLKTQSPSQVQLQSKDDEKNFQHQFQVCGKNTISLENSINKIQVSQPFNSVPFELQKQKPIIVKLKYHPYHLQFPTFYHLFHTLKPQNASASNNKFSMPHLLKSIELSLESYFKKQVLAIAKNQLQSKLALSDTNQSTQSSQNTQDQPNIQLKCITQLQFINSYQGSSVFDIDLFSFREKSMFLLKKLQNNFVYESQASKQSKNYLKQKLIKNDPLFYRVVRNKPEVYDIINTSFYRIQNWLELPRGMQLQGCWNLLWTWSKPQIDFNSLIKFQKVNHFPGSKELARKDLLKKNIQKIKKLSRKLNDYFDIIPDTYFLPGQNLPFIKKFRESQINVRNLWILKPVGLSRGRGISLVNKLQDVIFSEPIVMQKYINNPYLLQGYKFDLRIYVLVTSMNPLQCFVYKQGFARVSTQRYCNDVEEIDNKYVHLTNYSIQKDSMKSPGIFTERERLLGGCKLTLRMLRQRLGRRGVQWEGVWFEIKQVILKSLISCMKYIPQNPNCFELFGYDIMLDSQLKCWLIQVNSSPSLQQDFLIDQIVKQQLIDDTIEVVDPIQFNREELLKVIKRRRREVEGMKSHINYGNNSVDQLNQDLHNILQGKVLRNYGEVKQHVNFECLAPGNLYQKILKTVQHYTHDPFVKNNNFY